jgi:predicted nucleic acid-binding protein
MRYGIDSATLLLIADSGLAIDPSHSLVAPNRILGDLLMALLGEVRAGERDEKDALEVHTRATETKIRLLGDRVSRRTAWNLAREHDWADLRDAEYLAVTKLQADALVTPDARLAALASGIVEVTAPEVLGRA